MSEILPASAWLVTRKPACVQFLLFVGIATQIAILLAIIGQRFLAIRWWIVLCGSHAQRGGVQKTCWSPENHYRGEFEEPRQKSTSHMTSVQVWIPNFFEYPEVFRTDLHASPEVQNCLRISLWYWKFFKIYALWKFFHVAFLSCTLFVIPRQFKCLKPLQIPILRAYDENVIG